MSQEIYKILDRVYRELDLDNEKKLIERDYFLFHKERYNYILDIIMENDITKRPLKILEVGCGWGHLMIALSMLGHIVQGIDINKEIQNLKAYKKYNINFEMCNLSIQKFPYFDNFFDVIIFSEVLEHLNFHPKNIFKQIHYVLKVGGIILITTPNLLRLNNRIKLLIGKSINFDIKVDWNEGAHYREYTKKEINYLLGSSGFERIKVKYKNFDYPNINKLIKVINKVIGLIIPSLKGNLIITSRR